MVAALTNAVALRDASGLEAEAVMERRTRPTKVLGFETAVRHSIVVVGPVHFAKVRVCWMGDWLGHWPERAVVRLGGDWAETSGGSQGRLAGHHHHTYVEAVVQPKQGGRTNSVAPAVLGQGAGLVPALVELLIVPPAAA